MNKLTRRGLLAGAGLVGVAGAGYLGTLLLRQGASLETGTGRARPVRSSDRLPASVDVVVIGGGNIGCMTALTLAERGVSVALCEKGVIAGESSGRSLGYVDSQLLDPVKMPLIQRSKALWLEMNERVRAETGYVRSGMLAMLSEPEMAGFAEAWLDMVRDQPGFDARILTPREVTALVPGTRMAAAPGLYTPSDGIAEPKLFAPAVAEAVLRSGGHVLQRCAVRGIERSGGRVSGVVTEAGRIACTSVVLCGGTWSPVMARSLGLDLPQFVAFANALHVGKVDAGPKVALVTDAGVVMRPTLDGGFDLTFAEATAPITPSLLRNLPRLLPAAQAMWDVTRPALDVGTFMAEWRVPSQWPLDAPSPFEQNRVFQPTRRDDLLDRALAAAQAALPQLKNAPVLDRWAGALMSTPDNMPFISAIPEVPGLVVGSGFYYGLTMAPAAGEALADLVTGAKPQVDLAMYRHQRFDDGSSLEFRF